MPAYAFDSNAVLRGCELLGRHLKMFTDKVETKVTTGTHEEMLDELEGPVREPLPASPASEASLNGVHEKALDGLGMKK